MATITSLAQSAKRSERRLNALESAVSGISTGMVESSELDLNNYTSNGQFLLRGTSENPIVNAPSEYDTVGRFWLLSSMRNVSGNIFGFQMFGKIASEASTRFWYRIKYSGTGNFSVWQQVATEYYGVIYKVDADTLHGEAGRQYTGNYTLSYSSQAPNTNFAYNSKVSYLRIIRSAYSATTSNGVPYRLYRQVQTVGSITIQNAGETWERNISVVTSDCTATSGQEYHAGDILNKQEWRRVLLSDDLETVNGEINDIKRAAGNYELLSTTECTGQSITITFDEPLRNVFAYFECPKDTVRTASNLYAYQGSTIVGRLYFAAGTVTASSGNKLILRCWDDRGMFRHTFNAPSVSATNANEATYTIYDGIAVTTGISKLVVASSPSGATLKVYGIKI